MLGFSRSVRLWMPALAGATLGLSLTWWTPLHAALALPGLTLTSVTPGQIVSGVVPLSARADGSGLSNIQFQVSGQNVGPLITSGSCATSWNTAGVSNGSYTVTAVGSDSGGSTVWAAPVVVSVQNAAAADGTAPAVTVSAPTSGSSVSNTITLSASATDNVGVAGVWFTVDGTTVGSEDTTAPYQAFWSTTSVTNGAHTVRALARDAAGNIGTSAATTVNVSNTAIDSTAPTVSITSPGAGSTVSGTVSVAASATDNVGVTSVQFTLDGLDLGAADTSAPYSTSWNTTTVSAGSHTLRAVARDAVGNTTLSSTATVTVNNTPSDTARPVVSLTAPSAGATVSGTVTVSASASDNVGVASVQFTLDGANLGSADTTSPYATSWATSSASNGSHVLAAVARDAAGNVTTSSAITVTVNNVSTDTTRPTVSLTAPSYGAVVSGNVTISASASDNVGVVSVTFTVDGTEVGRRTATPYSIAWDSRTVANGSRVIRAIASDAAGNTRTSTSRRVTVSNTTADTVAPSVILTAPANGSTVNGTVSLTATATDNVGVVGVQFLLNGTAVGTEDTVAPYAVTWPTTGVPNGPQQIAAVARDAAGNRRTSSAITIAVSNHTGSGEAVDFNGDGKPDLLFAQNAGRLYTWFMNGSRMMTGSDLAPGYLPSGYAVATVNDFNGDHKSDLVLQNTTTGQVTLWAMDGTSQIGEAQLHEGETPWRVIGSGDLNDDGHVDLLWQLPATGELYVWLMDGPNLVAGTSFSVSRVDPRWRLAGTANLDNDEDVDLVWQNDVTGEIVVWLLDGPSVAQVRRLTPTAVNPNWRIRSVADHNGDGRPDLVFQHTTQAYLYIWYMNGTVMSGGEFLTPSRVASSWQVVGGQ